MISLRKAMDEQLQELLVALLENFKISLDTMGESAARACPQSAQGLAPNLKRLQEGLTSSSTPSQVKETTASVDGEMRAWSSRASDYYKQKAKEIKEIMALVARAAEQAGERDQRNAAKFRNLTDELSRVTDLEDLARVKQALVKNTAQLRDSIEEMVKDGEQSADQLRRQLSAYQSRLQEVEQLATKDPLTALDNRRKVEHEIENRVASGTAFCVLMIDLDRFKSINDRYGHACGDEILIQFSRELRSQFRYPDVVARWGGDEFLAIVEAGLPGAELCAKRVRQWVFGDYTLHTGDGPQKLRVEGAVGVAEWLPGHSANDVIKWEDAAMYEQKRSTRHEGGSRAIAQTAGHPRGN
jgi:diguanylate cyclase (GGDEF)-like protein